MKGWSKIMQGSVANPGSTNALTWDTIVSSTNGGATLIANFTSVNWLPVIELTNNTSYQAWFMVTAMTFATDAVFQAAAT
jgi:hypothetical protein